MARASLKHDVTVPTNPAQCWEAITNIEQVASWVDVLKDVREIEQLRHYEVLLADRLGPLGLRADLTIKVDDVQEGKSLHVHAEGEDRQVASKIKIDGNLLLEPVDAGTHITVEGTYEISGRVATLGAGMINAKANKLVQAFFARMEEALI